MSKRSARLAAKAAAPSSSSDSHEVSGKSKAGKLREKKGGNTKPDAADVTVSRPSSSSSVTKKRVPSGKQKTGKGKDALDTSDTQDSATDPYALVNEDHIIDSPPAETQSTRYVTAPTSQGTNSSSISDDSLKALFRSSTTPNTIADCEQRLFAASTRYRMKECTLKQARSAFTEHLNLLYKWDGQDDVDFTSRDVVKIAGTVRYASVCAPTQPDELTTAFQELGAMSTAFAKNGTGGFIVYCQFRSAAAAVAASRQPLRVGGRDYSLLCLERSYPPPVQSTSLIILPSAPLLMYSLVEGWAEASGVVNISKLEGESSLLFTFSSVANAAIGQALLSDLPAVGSIVQVRPVE